MNGPRYSTVEEYYAEIERSRDQLTAPTDKAVFYTNNDYRAALDHARSTNALTLEGIKEDKYCEKGEQVGQFATAYGAKLEADKLWDNSDPKTLTWNQQHGGRDNHSAARAVWDKTSRTYAEQADGKVEVFCKNRTIDPQKTFYRQELPSLINNSKVTEINGVSRAEMSHRLEAAGDDPDKQNEALEGICREIQTGHEHRDKRLGVEQGKTTATKVDTDKSEKKPGAWDRKLRAEEGKTTKDKGPARKF